MNYKELIKKIDITNELLFRLCIGQHIISKHDQILFKSLIPDQTHPCDVCKQRDCAKCEFK